MILTLSLAAILAAASGSASPFGTDVERVHLEKLVEGRKFDEAIDLGRAMLARLEAEGSGASLPAAVVLDLLARAKFPLAARDVEGMRWARRALEIRERLGRTDDLDYADSLNQYAGFLFLQDHDPHGVRRAYEHVLRIRERELGADHLNVGKSLHNLARVLHHLGDYAVARTLYDRALSIFERQVGPSSHEASVARYALGMLLAEIGDHDEAERCLRGHPAFEKAVQDDDASDLELLGRLRLDRGDVQGAHGYFERALRVWENGRGAESTEVAWGLENLAETTLQSGDTAAARPLIERALALRGRLLAPTHRDRAPALELLGNLLLREHRPEEARIAFGRCSSLLQASLGDGHPMLVRSLLGQSRADFAAGRQGPALDLALRAESIARRHFRRTAAGLAHREALTYESARASGLDLALSIALLEPARIGPKHLASVWDAVVRSRALVLDEMTSRRQALLAAEGGGELGRLYEDLEAARTRVAHLMEPGHEAGAREDPPARLREAERDLERVERRMAESSSRFRRDASRLDVGLARALESLPRDAALIAFTHYRRVDPKNVWDPGSPAYAALVAGGSASALRIVALGDAAAIEALVEQWRVQVQSPPASPSASVPAAERRHGDRLRDAIWTPAVRHVGGARRIFVVPDGALNLVNVWALPAEGSGYLVESGPAVQYLSAERDLVHPDPERAVGKGLIAVGGPRFDRRAGSTAKAPATAEPPVTLATARFRAAQASCARLRSLRFEALPASEVEATQVAAIWRSGMADIGDAVVLLGDRATEADVRKQMVGRRVVHVATHGYFLGGRCDRSKSRDGRDLYLDDPLLLSGLALAGANDRSATEGEVPRDDGLLTAEEIAELDLTAAEWVVLSACETGAGRIHEGEGVLGLRRAFEMAGARTLIMSLWQVEDEATQLWMKGLYEARRGGLSTAESMRRASLEVIRARRAYGLSDHPFFWGAFVAAGE